MEKELERHVRRKIKEMRGYEIVLKQTISILSKLKFHAELSGAANDCGIVEEIEKEMNTAWELLGQYSGVSIECESMTDAGSISRRVFSQEEKLLACCVKLVNLEVRVLDLYEAHMKMVWGKKVCLPFF